MKLDLLEDVSSSWGRTWFVTLEDIPDGDTVIKAGFVTDLASVPLPFWFILNPVGRKVARCAIIHDRGCRIARTFKERRDVDRKFVRCVWKRGIRLRAPIMYLGVRLNGVLTFLKQKIKGL